jgi:hypothetical protein
MREAVGDPEHEPSSERIPESVDDRMIGEVTKVESGVIGGADSIEEPVEEPEPAVLPLSELSRRRGRLEALKDTRRWRMAELGSECV